MTSIQITKDEIQFNTNERMSFISTSIGSIFMYAGQGINNISGNFLLCDGASYNRIEYADLFSIIQTKYGNGDSNDDTTFNVPNFKMHIPIGPNTGVNTINFRGINIEKGGNNSIEPSQFKHTHSIPHTSYVSEVKQSETHKNWSNTSSVVYIGYNRGGPNETTNVLDDNNNPIDPSNSKEHFPPYTAVNYIICYKV